MCGVQLFPTPSIFTFLEGVTRVCFFSRWTFEGPHQVPNKCWLFPQLSFRGEAVASFSFKLFNLVFKIL